MYTLYTTRDPSAPLLLNETKYADRVAQHGNSQNLYQQSVDAFGHCGYSIVSNKLSLFTEQATNAFDKLTAWVATGIRPE
jgi:hypothetical protein